jgi:CheY-like chemotaxis protein
MPAAKFKTSVAHQVLIVDDNDDIREAIGALLEVQGFAVAPAWSVEDAYRHLRQGFRPCVVVLDLHMPHVDGWAFLDRMRTEPRLSDVPVVVISGDPAQRVRVETAGYDFYRKPVHPAALIGAISTHCRQHLPNG